MVDEDDRDGAYEDECTVEEDDDGADPDAFTMAAEFEESFAPSAIPRVIAADGMPEPVVGDNHDDAVAPPYTEVSFVCKQDDREWVVRNRSGHVVGWVKPEFHGELLEPTVETLTLLAASAHYMIDVKKVEWCEPQLVADRKTAESLPPERPTSGNWPPEASRYGRTVEVEPVRKQCTFLFEKLVPPTPNERSQGIKYGWTKRYCTAQRSISGAYLNLTDDAISACSMRQPFDVATELLLQKTNRAKAEASHTRTYHEMFARARTPSPPQKEEGTPRLDELTADLQQKEKSDA